MVSCADRNYCRNDDYQPEAEMPDPIPFSLCGNLYRFDSGRIEIQIPTAEELREYPPYFGPAVLRAIGEWGRVLPGVGLVAVPHPREFSTRFGSLPYTPEKYVRGLTGFTVAEGKPDPLNLFSYSGLDLENSCYIETARVTLSPRVPESWVGATVVNRRVITRVIVHELGHLRSFKGPE